MPFFTINSGSSSTPGPFIVIGGKITENICFPVHLTRLPSLILGSGNIPLKAWVPLNKCDASVWVSWTSSAVIKNAPNKLS